MIIKETIERQCCHQKDLRPVNGTPMAGSIPRYVFCVHCGHHHVMTTFTDAAGSADWEYRKIGCIFQDK